MVHFHTVCLALLSRIGALLMACTMCGTGDVGLDEPDVDGRGDDEKVRMPNVHAKLMPSSHSELACQTCMPNAHAKLACVRAAPPLLERHRWSASC